MDLLVAAVATAVAVALVAVLAALRERRAAAVALRRGDAVVAALRAELLAAEERADDAEEGRRDAVDRLAVLAPLWELERVRSERQWRETWVPVPGGGAQVGGEDPFVEAVRHQLDRLREEIGLETELEGQVGAPLPAAVALVGLRATEELVATSARAAPAVSVAVGHDGDDLRVVVAADARVDPPSALRAALAAVGGELTAAEGPSWVVRVPVHR